MPAPGQVPGDQNVRDLFGGFYVVLVPDAFNSLGFFVSRPTNPAGRIVINNTWPSTEVIPAIEFFIQYRVSHPGAIFGLAASNAVENTTPCN